MDATMTAVIRLYEQGEPIKRIAHRLSLSEGKVKKILITAGLYSTPLTKDIAARAKAGQTVDEIAAALGMSKNGVLNNMPYSKGMYNAEYPSQNALKIRKCRLRKVLAAQPKVDKPGDT